MSKTILVAGNVNIETTLHIQKFPIEYSSLSFRPFGITSHVSGVSYNVALALKTLGDDVRLAAMTAQDELGQVVESKLKYDGIDTILSPQLDQTPQSVVIFDQEGRRQTNTDLKNLQELAFPQDKLEQAIEGCALVITGNVNFTRPLLKLAKVRQILIAADVQVIDDLDNEFQLEFMQSAQVLFMSNDRLGTSPEETAHEILEKFGTEIIVIGLGAEGVLLSVKSDNFMERLPSFYTRPVVNTTGAGDALFAAFNHFYNSHSNPYEAIKKAQVFASYKIGENGSSRGFLNAENLEDWYVKLGYQT